MYFLYVTKHLSSLGNCVFPVCNIVSLVYRLNDVIVSVNGVSTENVTHAQAVDALKRAGRNVLLVSLGILTLTMVYSTVNGLLFSPLQWCTAR